MTVNLDVADVYTILELIENEIAFNKSMLDEAKKQMPNKDKYSFGKTISRLSEIKDLLKGELTDYFEENAESSGDNDHRIDLLLAQAESGNIHSVF